MNKGMIVFEQDKYVGTVTMFPADGPEPLTQEMVLAFNEILEEISWNSEIRLLVITGKNAFSFESYPSPADGISSVECSVSQLSICSIVEQIKQPVLAVIEGNAVGHGLELAMTCDIRISTDRTRFGFPNVKHSSIPFDGGTQRLPRIVGRAKAMEMLLTGELISAREALRIGLVSSIVEPDALQDTAMETAIRIIPNAPVAVAFTKEALKKGMEMTLGQGLNLESDLYFLIHTTEDRKRGIQAFRDNKTAMFTGR